MNLQSYLIFSVALLIIVGILLVGHYFIYRSIISFFKIDSLQLKLVLALVLSVLAISFIASSLLVHFSENLFSRFYYLIAGLWLGVFNYLLIGFAVIWFLVFVFNKFNFKFDLAVLGFLAITAALIYSAYGLWSAFHPRIKEISIKISNLPVFWQNKTAVQISDLHLGAVLGEDFLQQVVNQVNGQNPDIIFITGDLLDSMEGRVEFSIETLNELQAPAGIYFITGNHETYFGLEKTYQLLGKTKIRILKDELINLNGLQLIGLSFPQQGERKNLSAALNNLNFDRDLPSILLYHSPVQTKQMAVAGISLQLAGHTHVGQMTPFNFISYLIYGKYHYGLHQEGDYTIYTTSGTGVWGPTLRTAKNSEIVAIKLENK